MDALIYNIMSVIVTALVTIVLFKLLAKRKLVASSLSLILMDGAYALIFFASMMFLIQAILKMMFGVRYRHLDLLSVLALYVL